jgi:ABC-type dipeptide/oligopeptide/nickel transport system permease component
MAWASIERHILIFYPSWFGTKRKCFFFHYLPLAVCILYSIIFYTVTLVIIPCDHTYDYGCIIRYHYQCIYLISWLRLWDSIGHFMIPAFMTPILSVALFVRVLYSRYRVHRDESIEETIRN